MLNAITPTILAAERVNDGVVIKFSNSTCAFYSDAFLWAKVDEVGRLDEKGTE